MNNPSSEKTALIKKEQVPEVLFKFAQKFLDSGKEVFLVGGILRDIIFYKDKKIVRGDYDFATNARPDEVQKIFKKTIPTGIKHGTITVLFRGTSFEVTTYRADGIYSDGRRPDEVNFSDSIEEDLKRRDFTVNAMALNLNNMELIDLFGGLQDLNDHIIRAVGDPLKRFMEDGLRPLRACRFAGKLGFKIEENTFKAIPQSIDVFKQVAVERIREELIKMMESENPSLSIESMRTSGILKIIIPELLEGLNIEQNEYHKFDIYYHNLKTCDAAPADKPIIRFAALLHDIGKVRAMNYAKKNNSDLTENVFYNHEIIGARMADRILKRLKFSNNERISIVHLIKHHMFHYTDEWSDGAVRRLMRNVGVDKLDDLFDLRKADRIGNGKKSGPSKALHKLQKRIDIIIQADNAITVRDLKVNGYDIMTNFKLKPSRLIGDILDYLLEVILDTPEKNDKEILLSLTKEYLEQK